MPGVHAMYQKFCRALVVSGLLMGSASSLASAQDAASHAVYLEGLGAGLFYSVNDERRIIDDLGLRAGFGYVSLSTSAGGVAF